MLVKKGMDYIIGTIINEFKELKSFFYLPGLEHVAQVLSQLWHVRSVIFGQKELGQVFTQLVVVGSK